MPDEINELDQPIWAVGTQTKILGSGLTYKQALDLVESNWLEPGVAIITSEAAKRQKENHGR